MKRIIFLISIFVFCFSSCFAESTNVLPKDTNFLYSFDYEWANKNLVIGNEYTRFVSTLKTYCKDKFSLDFDKDVKRIIYFKKKDEYFCAVSGNNVTNKIFSFSNLSLKPVDNNFFIQTPKEIIALIEQGKAFVYIDGKSLPEVAGELIANITGMRSMRRMFTNVPEEAKKNNPVFMILDNIDYIMVYFEENFIKVEIKCNDSESSDQLLTSVEGVRTIYSSKLQKDIDTYREKLKNSIFADFAMISFALYSHSKAKRFIDSIEIELGEDESVVFLKTKFDIAYIVRSVASIVLSKELGSDKYIEFVTAKDKLVKNTCFYGQNCLKRMIKSYFNTSVYKENGKMTTLDEKKLLDFIEKKNYHPLEMPGYKKAKENPECEFYSVGDLSKDGYIACKVHGSPDAPSTKVTNKSSTSNSMSNNTATTSSYTNTSNNTTTSSSNSSSNSTSSTKNNSANYDTREYKPIQLKPYKTHPKVVVPEELELEP